MYSLTDGPQPRWIAVHEIENVISRGAASAGASDHDVEIDNIEIDGG